MFQINGVIPGLSSKCGSFSMGIIFVQIQRFWVHIFPLNYISHRGTVCLLESTSSFCLFASFVCSLLLFKVVFTDLGAFLPPGIISIWGM